MTEVDESAGKWLVGRWVSGKWSVGRWVGGLVVGGFNKTQQLTGFRKNHCAQQCLSCMLKIWKKVLDK